MLYTCFLCKWRSDKLPRRSYDKFPSKEELKQKWLNILGKSHVSIGKRATLCCLHFEEDCFRYGLVNGTRILKDGSWPTLHLSSSSNNTENRSVDDISICKIKYPESVMESSFHTQHPITMDVQMKESTSELNIEGNRKKPLTSKLEDASNHVEIPMDICSLIQSSRKSDHFRNESFHQTDDHTTVRRLLTTTVPTIIGNSESEAGEVLVGISNTVAEETNKDDMKRYNDSIPVINILDKHLEPEVLLEVSNTVIEANNKMNVIELTNEEQNITNITESEALLNILNTLINKNDQPKTETHENISITENSNLKSLYPSNTKKSAVKQRFFFREGFRTESISRSDFVSDEAWERFIRFMNFKSKQLANFRKKCYRGKKKVENFNTVIENLKSKNDFTAAEYLQGLPDHLMDLITRMKNKKATVPYPANLKSFAVNLYLNAPVAYEVIRHTFLKCLPSVDTLNRWSSSNNLDSGILDEVFNDSNVGIDEYNKMDGKKENV